MFFVEREEAKEYLKKQVWKKTMKYSEDDKSAIKK